MGKKRVYFAQPPPRNRAVVGPYGEIGIIAKAPGHGQQRDRFLLAQKRRYQTSHDQIQKSERYRHEAYDSRYWSSSDIRQILGRVRRCVDLGLEAADEDLNAKRNRVKAMLLEEEAAYTLEYVDRAQKSADFEFNRKKQCAQEIVQRQATEEREFIQDAYTRLFQESNDEFKKRRSDKFRRELNAIHERQMRDKELMRLKEKEDTDMWMAIMDKEERAKEGLRQADTNQRKMNFEKNKEIQRKQMFGMKMKRENEEALKREELAFWKEVNEHNEKEADWSLRERRVEEGRYWRALKGQIEDNKLARERKEKEEKGMDQLMFDYNSAVLENERAQKVEHKEEERMEQSIFKESQRQFKEVMSNMEEESERLIRTVNEKKLAAKRELRKRARDVRKEFYMNCQRDCERQFEAAKLKKDGELRVLEIYEKDKLKRRAQNAHLEKCKANEREEWLARQRAMNDEFVKYRRVLAERAQEEEKELLNRLRSCRDEDLEKSKRLLNNPRPQEVHPAVVVRLGPH